MACFSYSEYDMSANDSCQKIKPFTMHGLSRFTSFAFIYFTAQLCRIYQHGEILNGSCSFLVVLQYSLIAISFSQHSVTLVAPTYVEKSIL